MRRPPGAEPDVLLVSQFFPPAIGGSASLLANVYSRLGRPVRVLTDSGSSPSADGPSGALDIRHARLATPHWGVAHPAGLLRHARTAALLRRLARPRAAVHCARVLPEGVAAWLARRAGGPPYVCWSHGEDLATAGTSRELTVVTRLVLRGAACALANSANTAALLERFGVPRSEVRVAYPGVDPQRFRPDVDGNPLRRRLGAEHDLLLLSVGRLQRRKGHDTAIRALAALGSGRAGVRYVIVGTGEEEATLRRLAEECGVAGRGSFAGAVADAELPSYYAACDVFLLPNRKDGEDIEGFGIVFLEAQAAARPVVAGKTGGAPEAVAEGETGLLVGGDDVAELAAALDALLSSADLRAKLGSAGRARVLREFSWERAAGVVRALVEEMQRA
ncbi:MAG: glycosyltransferase [Candidatus Eiseniibacteriota bacterium]